MVQVLGSVNLRLNGQTKVGSGQSIFKYNKHQEPVNSKELLNQTAMVPFYHIAQVSHLFVHGIRGEFQTLTNINDDDLAHYFEKCFEYVPADQQAKERSPCRREKLSAPYASNGN
ncbi:hypothetical protein ABES58_24250 [Paenibacillus lautus]|uniref:hypothetical protein n=1 Tax=Paenibacillus lautus TaxID=1401 RepID=UPI003D26FDED